MAAKLKFLTIDELCSIQVESDKKWLTLIVDTPELDAHLGFDHETALALRNQIDLLLKTIEPVKPKK